MSWCSTRRCGWTARASCALWVPGVQASRRCWRRWPAPRPRSACAGPAPWSSTANIWGRAGAAPPGCPSTRSSILALALARHSANCLAALPRTWCAGCRCRVSTSFCLSSASRPRRWRVRSAASWRCWRAWPMKRRSTSSTNPPAKSAKPSRPACARALPNCPGAPASWWPPTTARIAWPSAGSPRCWQAATERYYAEEVAQ